MERILLMLFGKFIQKIAFKKAKEIVDIANTLPRWVDCQLVPPPKTNNIVIRGIKRKSKMYLQTVIGYALLHDFQNELKREHTVKELYTEFEKAEWLLDIESFDYYKNHLITPQKEN